MYKNLDVKTDDQLLEKSVNQEVFEMCLHEYFTECCTKSAATLTDSVRPLTADEMNVIRYVGGYVARSLLKRYEKQKVKVHVSSQFIDCLGEMTVEGDDVLTYTRTWFDVVNRGGLYQLNDDAFTFFVNIEMCSFSPPKAHG